MAGFNIPQPMTNHVILNEQTQLTDEEKRYFEDAIMMVCVELVEQNYDFENMGMHDFLFTLDMSGSFHSPKSKKTNALGHFVPLMIFAMERIRNTVIELRGKSNKELLYLLVFLEEMCHNYFNIANEVRVKEKVIELLNKHGKIESPPTDIHTFYNEFNIQVLDDTI